MGNARPSVINNTFLQNTATALTGTRHLRTGRRPGLRRHVTNLAPAPLLANNLIAYNSSGVSVSGPRCPGMYNNLVWGNVRANYDGIPDPTGTNGNLSLPPGPDRALRRSPSRPPVRPPATPATIRCGGTTGWTWTAGTARRRRHGGHRGRRIRRHHLPDPRPRFLRPPEGATPTPARRGRPPSRPSGAALAEAAPGRRRSLGPGRHLPGARSRRVCSPTSSAASRATKPPATRGTGTPSPRVLDGGAEPTRPVAGAAGRHGHRHRWLRHRGRIHHPERRRAVSVAGSTSGARR